MWGGCDRVFWGKLWRNKCNAHLFVLHSWIKKSCKFHSLWGGDYGFCSYEYFLRLAQAQCGKRILLGFFAKSTSPTSLWRKKLVREAKPFHSTRWFTMRVNKQIIISRIALARKAITKTSRKFNTPGLKACIPYTRK